MKVNCFVHTLKTQFKHTVQ